jgi:hypothetical protein
MESYCFQPFYQTYYSDYVDLCADIYRSFILKSPSIASLSPRPLSRSSTSKGSNRSSFLLSTSPSYTEANPFLHQASAHSLTHPVPTHKVAPCLRCNKIECKSSHKLGHPKRNGGSSVSSSSSASFSSSPPSQFALTWSSKTAAILGYNRNELPTLAG